MVTEKLARLVQSLMRRRRSKARTGVRKEEDMTDYEGFTEEERRAHRSDEHAAWRARGRSVWRWLATRPAESWLFFVGGLLLGKILL